ncbi:MAG: extracellular solute-binding protein [Eubacterium sp.]|nr:extracellular solute-binding protein [Eubacterium sp.]
MSHKIYRTGMAVIFTVLLAGCVGNTPQTEKADSIQMNENDDEIVLSVLAGQSTSDAGIEDMIDDFLAEEFPSVKLEWECVDWGESFDSQLRGRIAAGDVPDIMIGKAQDVGTYSKEGILAQIQLEQFASIDPAAMETVTVDGKVYGMPYNAWYQGVIYNKDIFDRLGLRVPNTLEELEQVVTACRENGVVPFATHYRENWKVANMTMQFLTEGVFAEERDWGERFREGAVTFSGSAEVRKAVEQNRYICENTWDDAWSIDQYESDKRFAEGKAAMYLTGTWSLQSMEQYTAENRFGIFPYPIGKNPRLIKEINMTYMISSESEYQQLVQEIFAKLVSDEDLMQEILGFTQTYSIVDGIASGYQSNVQEDIDQYEKTGCVIGADIGNSQLVWNFQSDLAAEIMKWLKDEETIGEVLKYADDEADASGI